MAKTLKDFLNERQLGPMVVKNPDEQKFIDKHVTAKTQDRNGNGDDVFNAANIKKADRKKERHGYEPGDDEKVYENHNSGYYVMRNGQSISYHKDKESADKRARVANMRGGSNATVVQDDSKMSEELKGNQHKIDANKNGKVDAHDFHLLRKKKKVAEEAEQIDELSPSTMGSYTKKASADFTARKPKMGYDGQLKKMQNRRVGVNRALDKMYGEEAEQIDELSHDTLRRYRMKAKSIGDNEKGDINYRAKGRELAGRKTYGGRMAGIEKAKVMAKEEAEQVDEKLDMKKASMGTVINDFQKSKAPQFQGRSQKKRQAMAVAAKLTAERGKLPMNKEERLLIKLADLAETHQRTMVSVFEKLNEDNQYAFMQACDTADGIEQMLDFSISYRGE